MTVATKHAVYPYCSAIRREIRGLGVVLSVLMTGVVATETAAGTSRGMVKPLTPQQIADAIEGLIRRLRPKLFIPARGGHAAAFLAAMPASVRGFFHRRLVPDQASVSYQNVRGNYAKKMLSS